MKPEIGQKIYIPSSFYLSHGRDDIQGGKTEITKVYFSNHLPEDHYNYIMVNVKGLPVSKTYNYRYLMENQKEWKDKYKDTVAHPDPDLHPDSNPKNYGWDD